MLKVDLDLDILNVYIIFILGIVTLLYMFTDVHYFIRAAATITYATYVQKRLPVDATDEMQGFCTTQDMDFFLTHMNNARYIREADFGRFQYFARTGILTEIRNNNGQILQGALTIRYRKPIPTFSTFTLKTRIIYWDDKSVYFEQQFCSADGFVKAVMLSQNKIININIKEIITRLLKKDESYKPEVDEELKLWMESIEASSKRLRNTTCKTD